MQLGCATVLGCKCTTLKLLVGKSHTAIAEHPQIFGRLVEAQFICFKCVHADTFSLNSNLCLPRLSTTRWQCTISILEYTKVTMADYCSLHAKSKARNQLNGWKSRKAADDPKRFKSVQRVWRKSPVFILLHCVTVKARI